MSKALIQSLAEVKAAIVAGDANKALARIERFSSSARRTNLSGPERERLEAGLTELRGLAEASLRGARQAFEDVQAIVLAARTLQTYDQQGRRQVSTTAAPAPHRF